MRHSTNTVKIHLVFLMVIFIAFSGATQAADVSGLPGYVDLDFIEIPDDAEEIQDINLGPVLKDVVRQAKENDDLEIAELLTMVHSLRMRGFSVDYKSEKMARDAVEKIAARLKADDWDNLMKFKDGDELTTISTKYHDDNMVGLMIVVFSPGEEAMFINVVGDLDLGKLMRLATELDTEELEAYLGKVESGSSIHVE